MSETVKTKGVPETLDVAGPYPKGVGARWFFRQTRPFHLLSTARRQTAEYPLITVNIDARQ